MKKLIILCVCLGITSYSCSTVVAPAKNNKAEETKMIVDVEEPEFKVEIEEEVMEEKELVFETYEATAYCACVKCCGIWSKQHPTRVNDSSFVQRTKSGTEPMQGRTIGAARDGLPLGTVVEIQGLGTYVVEDTLGASSTGKRIDIFFDSHQEALNWGRREVQLAVVTEG